MAEQFLSQLLRMENTVQSDGSQQCYICMLECGTISPDTGVIEREICLPCNSNHKFGSACIATWLKDHNTCPICRHELFPKTTDDSDEDENGEFDPLAFDPLAPMPRLRRTRLSNEAADEQQEDYRRGQAVILARAERMSVLVIGYSTTLHLHAAVTRCAQTIADKAEGLSSLDGRSDFAIAAAAIYVASHLRRQPVALREISQLANSTEGTIQAIYRRIYAYFHNVSREQWRDYFNTPYDLPYGDRHGPPWPPLEHEFADGENGDDEEFIQEIWSRLSTGLDLQPAVSNIARPMATRLESWRRLAHLEPKVLIAFSVWIASCVAGQPISPISISSMAGYRPLGLLWQYRWIYRYREQLLDHTMNDVVLPAGPTVEYIMGLHNS